MPGPTSQGVGAAGSIAQGAVASSVYNDNSSTSTDASEHLGISTGAQSIGSTVSLAGSTVQNLTLTDAGAVAAGQAVAIAAIQGNAAATQSLAADAQYAIGRASDLAVTAAQGQGGMLIKAVVAIAALGVVGGLIWFFGGKKKQGKPND